MGKPNIKPRVPGTSAAADKSGAAGSAAAPAPAAPAAATGSAATSERKVALTPLGDLRLLLIAAVAHEVNRAYCQALGDESQPAWADAPEWQRESAVNGVQFHLDNPEAGADASHANWLAEKLADGWVYGPEKNPEAKQHPCCVPFAELLPEQQAKDFLFRGVVHALANVNFSQFVPLVTRDAHRGGDNYEATLLRELLSLVHGDGKTDDGGAYVEEHGLDAAHEAALEKLRNPLVVVDAGVLDPSAIKLKPGQVHKSGRLPEPHEVDATTITRPVRTTMGTIVPAPKPKG